MAAHKYIALVLIVVSTLLSRVSTCAEDEPDHVIVIIQTELGDIEAEINTRQAPITSANFLAYVSRGHYDGGRFYRTLRMDNQPANKIKIEVIQGGMNATKEGEALAPIKLERTNQTGLRHSDGTLSMARAGVDTAKSDFFICIGDQPSLDYGGLRNPDGKGFAAFGRVTRGMDIVRRIQGSAAEGQRLSPPIKILTIRRKA